MHVYRSVVHSSSGVLAPGKMTLLLAPARSGKSSLMKILAGRVASSRFHGKVWYGGRLAEEVNVNRLVGFVGQDDVHLPLLTVTETLEFSLACLNDPSSLSPELQLATARKVANLIQVWGRVIVSLCAVFVTDPLLP
jgi:ABC-type multidrug transport system ATPase subunit